MLGYLHAVYLLYVDRRANLHNKASRKTHTHSFIHITINKPLAFWNVTQLNNANALAARACVIVLILSLCVCVCVGLCVGLCELCLRA